MELFEERLTIGQVAEKAGVATSSIRYYESIGLLPIADREGGQRRYDEDVLRTIEMIGVAQKAGFSLREIKVLMAGFAAGEDIAAPMRTLAKVKLTEVNAMLEHARRMRTWLELASGCDCASPDECTLFDDTAADGTPLKVVHVVTSDGGWACRKTHGAT